MRVATLSGDVVLRQPVPDVDGSLLQTWFADDPEGAWQVFLERPSPDQRAVLEAGISGLEHHNWIIEVGEPVGLVRLSTRNRPPGKAALLYYVAPPDRNHGYATRAVARVVRHAFEDLGFAAVLADVLLTNQSSAAVLSKVGFKPTGQLTLARTDQGAEQLAEWARQRDSTGPR